MGMRCKCGAEMVLDGYIQGTDENGRAVERMQAVYVCPACGREVIGGEQAVTWARPEGEDDVVVV